MGSMGQNGGSLMLLVEAATSSAAEGYQEVSSSVMMLQNDRPANQYRVLEGKLRLILATPTLLPRLAWDTLLNFSRQYSN